MADTKPKSHVTIRINADLHHVVRVEAAQKDLTVSAYVELLIKEGRKSENK